MINLHCPFYIIKLADLTKNLCVSLSSCSQYLALKMLFEFFFGEYDSVSHLIRNNSWTLSESQFLNLLLGFEGNRFLRRIRFSVLRKYKGELNPFDFVLAFDDTDNPKYSKLLSNVQSWRSSKGMYFGQKILVLALVNAKEKFAIPIDYRICLPKKKQNKEKNESAIDLAFELLLLHSKDFYFIPVVADSWFDSSELAMKLRENGITYVWELKSNRKVKCFPGKKQKYFSLHNTFYNLARKCVNTVKNKWISEKIIILKSNRMSVKTVATYNRKNGKDAFAYYATNDRSMPGEMVWKIFRARWNIESLFRDLKSYLNFGRLSTSNDKVNELAFVIPFIIIAYLRLNPEAFGLKNKMTVAGMLKTLRTQQDNFTIDSILGGEFLDLIKKIKIRRNRINKKPVIQGTEAKIAA